MCSEPHGDYFFAYVLTTNVFGKTQITTHKISNPLVESSNVIQQMANISISLPHLIALLCSISDSRQQCLYRNIRNVWILIIYITYGTNQMGVDCLPPSLNVVYSSRVNRLVTLGLSELGKIVQLFDRKSFNQVFDIFLMEKLRKTAFQLKS